MWQGALLYFSHRLQPYSICSKWIISHQIWSWYPMDTSLHGICESYLIAGMIVTDIDKRWGLYHRYWFQIWPFITLSDIYFLYSSCNKLLVEFHRAWPVFQASLVLCCNDKYFTFSYSSLCVFKKVYRYIFFIPFLVVPFFMFWWTYYSGILLFIVPFSKYSCKLSSTS